MRRLFLMFIVACMATTLHAETINPYGKGFNCAIELDEDVTRMDCPATFYGETRPTMQRRTVTILNTSSDTSVYCGGSNLCEDAACLTPVGVAISPKAFARFDSVNREVHCTLGGPPGTLDVYVFETFADSASSSGDFFLSGAADVTGTVDANLHDGAGEPIASAAGTPGGGDRGLVTRAILYGLQAGVPEPVHLDSNRFLVESNATISAYSATVTSITTPSPTEPGLHVREVGAIRGHDGSDQRDILTDTDGRLITMPAYGECEPDLTTDETCLEDCLLAGSVTASVPAGDYIMSVFGETTWVKTGLTLAAGGTRYVVGTQIPVTVSATANYACRSAGGTGDVCFVPCL